MRKNEIGGALLVILGITIGIIIGVVISKRGIQPPTRLAKVVYSAHLPNHVNPFPLSQQFDQATVLHAARRLKHENTLTGSSHFDHTQAPDAGAAAPSGNTPEFTTQVTPGRAAR